MNRLLTPEKQKSTEYELFYMDKTMMVFDYAKKVIEDMVKAVE
jgi:NAD/NADP transhydrogenase beta subunit